MDCEEVEMNCLEKCIFRVSGLSYCITFCLEIVGLHMYTWEHAEGKIRLLYLYFTGYEMVCGTQ